MVESVLLSVLWMVREVTSECNSKQKKGTKGVMMGHLLKYDSEIERRSRERVYDKCNRKTNTLLILVHGNRIQPHLLSHFRLLNGF